MTQPTAAQQELTAYIDVLAPLALVGLAALAAGITLLIVYAGRYLETSREVKRLQEILGVTLATVDELRRARRGS